MSDTKVGKAMFYEDRDEIYTTLELRINRFGLYLTEEQEKEFGELFDTLLEPFTEGDWRNYN